MTPLQIVLVVLLVPITLFNLLFLTSGRRKNKEGRMRYQAIMTELQDKAVEELGSSKDLVAFPYLSDAEQGCLLCINKKKDLVALVTYDTVLKMRISEPKSCEVLSDIRDGKLLSLCCVVTHPASGQSLSVPFATRPHRVKGYFGRFLIENAEEFRKRVLGLEEA